MSSIRLTCVRCGEVSPPLDTEMRMDGVSLLEWWEARGRLCSPCLRQTAWRDDNDITSGFHGGSETSADAHESMKQQKAWMRTAVLTYVAAQGNHGATCDETEVALGMPHQTCSARFTELHARNQLVKNGVKRETRSGRKAFVHFARRKSDD